MKIFRIFLVVFGVSNASSNSEEEEEAGLSRIEKIRAIDKWWTTSYLSFPECVEKAESRMTDNRKNTFAEVREGCSKCQEDDLCLENYLDNYYTADIDGLYMYLDNVKQFTSAEEMWKISRAYFSVLGFVSQVILKSDERDFSITKDIVNKFTEEEKNFMLSLTTKRMNFLFKFTNTDTCKKLVNYLTDNEMINHLTNKTSSVWDTLTDENLHEHPENENFLKLILNDLVSVQNSEYFRSPEFKQAPVIFKWWISMYLNHPKFSEPLDANLTKEQKDIFKQVCEGYFKCMTSDKKDADLCVKNFMQRFDTKKIDALVKVFDKVKDSLPDEKVEDVSSKYYSVLSFAAEMLDNLHRVNYARIRGEVWKYTDDEKIFIMTLLQKWNHYLYNYSNLNVLESFASFLIDIHMVEDIEMKIMVKVDL